MAEIQNISEDWEGHTGSEVQTFIKGQLNGISEDVGDLHALLVNEQETPASSTDVTGYLYSGGYFFYADGVVYHCLAIPCSAGKKYRIYNANGFDGAQVSLLWMVFNTTENLSENRSAVIAKSTGITTGSQDTYDVTIPTGGVMLYVAYYPDHVPTVKLVTEEYAGLQELRDDVNAAAASADAARSAATNAASAAASAQQDIDGLKNALATEVLEPENATDVSGYLYINHYFSPGGTYHCKVVNVSEGEKYRIDNTNGFDGSTRSALYMVFNNADNVGQTSAKIMESSQTTGTQDTYDITIPSGGVVLYVAYYPGYEATVRKITSSYTIVASKAFIGTFDRTVVLGDSISTLFSGNSLKWSDYVAEQLGVTIHNYAIGGANIAGMEDTQTAASQANRNLIYQIKRLPTSMASVAIAEGEEDNGTYTYTVDNLIISMGFNDANNNRTIGDYDTVVAADWTTLEPATTTTNFASIMAAVKWAIFRLKSSPLMAEVNGNGIIIDCTKARIIWQTPIQCSSNGNWASLGGYEALNDKLIEVEQAIVRICAHYGVPVVIGRTASGISTEVELLTQEWNGTAVVNNTGKYLKDGIHPNDVGMRLLGQMNLAGLLGAASNQSDTRQSGGAITIDSVPTEGSANAVSSGGVYTALAGKADSSHTHAIADVSGLQSELDGLHAQLEIEQETPASSPDVTGYLYSGGYFSAGGVYHCLAIPCTAGEKYRIYNANGFDGATVSLLWMVFNTTENLSENRSAVIAKSTGITTGSQDTYDVTIPTGGVMLYVAYYPNLVPTVTLVKEYVHTDNNFTDEYKEMLDSGIAGVTGLQSALNAKQDALTKQTALGGVNGKMLNYGRAVVLSGEDIPLSSGSSTNVKNAIALINNNLAGKQDTLSFGTGLEQSGNQVSVNTASAIASGETGYTTGGQVYSALAGKQDTIAKGSVTIAVSDWSSNTCTVTATGVTVTNTVIVSPDSASMADYAAAGVQCTAQGADTLSFTCTSTPTSSLTINYIAI